MSKCHIVGNPMHWLNFRVFQVQTDGQQIGENQVLFIIQDADNINHIVVFMTGQTPFPDGLGGAGNCVETRGCNDSLLMYRISIHFLMMHISYWPRRDRTCPRGFQQS